MSVFLATFLKPFIVLFALGGLLLVRMALQRWLPPGRIKRFLLFDLTEGIEEAPPPKPPARR